MDGRLGGDPDTTGNGQATRTGSGQRSSEFLEHVSWPHQICPGLSIGWCLLGYIGVLGFFEGLSAGVWK